MDIRYIYIPVWFYFNYLLDNESVIIDGIYIPVWFYFNLYKLRENVVYKIIFTFQYGSTLIR